MLKENDLCVYCEPFNLSCWFSYEPHEDNCAVDDNDTCMLSYMNIDIICEHYSKDRKNAKTFT